MRLRLTPDRISCTCVPSPQSNRNTSPSRMSAVEERLRVSVGTAELVPRRTIRMTTTRAKSSSLASNAPEGRSKDVTSETGIFAQPADGVGVPILSKWNVDTKRMAGGENQIAQFLVHPEQHLEFVGGRFEVQLAD